MLETTTSILLITSKALLPWGFIQGVGKGVGGFTRHKLDPKSLKNGETTKIEKKKLLQGGS